MRQTGALYRFELKKLVSRKLVWIFGSIMIFLCAFLSFGDLPSSFSWEDTEVGPFEAIKMRREYAGNLAGKAIDDALLLEMKDSCPVEAAEEQNIINDRKLGISGSITESAGEDGERTVLAEQMDRGNLLWEYEPVYTFMTKIIESGILETDARELYAEREHLIALNRADQVLTEKELRYWEKKGRRIETPFSYEYADGFGRLWEYAYTINYMLLLMLSICLSNMFSAEHSRKTDAVILCSRYGREHLYLAKILAGMTFGAFFAAVFFGAAAASSIFIYGADGFGAALQLVYPLSSWNVSAGESVLILFFLLLVVSVLYSAVIMVLSEMLKNSVAVMAFPVGLMILTMISDIPYQFRAASQIYDLLPTNLLIKWELWDDRLVSVCGKYLTNVQLAPAVYVLAAAVLFLIGRRMYRRCQVGA